MKTERGEREGQNVLGAGVGTRRQAHPCQQRGCGALPPTPWERSEVTSNWGRATSETGCSLGSPKHGVKPAKLSLWIPRSP